MLNLMYITNQFETAKIADQSGVDRIIIDLETMGKYQRQRHIDSVKSQHVIEDIPMIKSALKTAKLLVRVNPIHEQSQVEIDQAIVGGADIVMLPMFQTVREAEIFLKMVDGKAKVCLLTETVGAIQNLDDILKVDGVNEIYIGLNDLHISMGQDFLFEPLADGTVDTIFQKAHSHHISCGFGGVAHIGSGDLPAERIITEHYRLGSRAVILSRKFCDYADIELNPQHYAESFASCIQEIRHLEDKLAAYADVQFEENRKIVVDRVNQIVSAVQAKKKV